MVDEQSHLNRTLHIHPWSLLDDPTFDMSFPYPDVAVNSDGNAFYGDSLTALQHPLSSNDFNGDCDTDFSGPESEFPLSVYSTDEFRMYDFKVRRCVRGRSHDWTDCPFAHPGEKARRRDPCKFLYSGTPCPDYRKGNCKKGESCEFAHGVFECWLHPDRYRTQPCKDGTDCRRRVCFFAHSQEQLRVAPQQSPRTNSAESYDGSPLRQAIEAAYAKGLPYLSSPTSMSPGSTPTSGSPPVSPMTRSLSRSVGTNSVSELVASLRQLQIGKVKSVPHSWGVQVGSPCFGSPGGSMLRPDFCSLPSTPTRIQTHPGIGLLEFGEKDCQEEPVMERVESGRDLRAKMYEKLSKENSFNRVNPTTSSGPTPDVGWVSELVK